MLPIWSGLFGSAFARTTRTSSSAFGRSVVASAGSPFRRTRRRANSPRRNFAVSASPSMTAALSTEAIRPLLSHSRGSKYGPVVSGRMPHQLPS